MWRLITWKKEFYFYPHGYIRTSSDEYTLDSKLNYVHLTNNCLQKHGEKYGTFEDGNTIGFYKFIEFLNEEYKDYHINFEEHFIGRIKDLMIDTYLSVEKQLNPILVIKDFLGIPEKKPERVVSVQQAIYKQLRSKMNSPIKDYNEKQDKKLEAEIMSNNT